MEKIRRTEVEKIINEITETLVREMGKRGYEVGIGDIKTEDDLLGIRSHIEEGIRQNIKSHYELYDC